MSVPAAQARSDPGARAGAVMVEIQGVSKNFHKTVKDHTTELKALAGVNLSIREKEFVSIIGPSGCGKTTLLKIIDGLIPADGGEILINGKRITSRMDSAPVSIMTSRSIPNPSPPAGGIP